MPTEEIESHLTAGRNMKKRQIMLANFLGGMAWGFGSVIGGTIMVAILIGVLSQLKFIPPVSELLKTMAPPTRIQRNLNNYSGQ